MSRVYIEHCQNCISDFKVNDETQRDYEVELFYCPFCGIELDAQEQVEEIEWSDDLFIEQGC